MFTYIYSGFMKNILTLKKEDLGKILEIKKQVDNKLVVYKGYLLDISENIIKLKLIDNWYEIGISKNHITEINILENPTTPKPIQVKLPDKNSSFLNLVLIGTGGTIACEAKDLSGNLAPLQTPLELISKLPELKNLANFVKLESPFIKPSENINYKDWQMLSEVVFKHLLDTSVDGIIITHGTDTLTHTASALSFMIENINKPVVFVGSQRSSDRPSFDGALNLICATHFIKEKIPGVFICMHAQVSDNFCNILNPVKSKKMHTSRRDAFKPINSLPICKVFSDGKIEYFTIVEKHKQEKPILFNNYEERVALLKIYPNIDLSIIEWYIKNGYKGLVIEGFGLGHLPLDVDSDSTNNFLKLLKKAHAQGVLVFMTSQSIYGSVSNKVYETARLLSQHGVEYLESHDMLSEVLLIKLGISLKKYTSKNEQINFLKKNIVGELANRELLDFF